MAPTYGQQLLRLDQDALSVLRDRIIAAMGSQSQSMEMTIANSDTGSAVEIARDLINAQDVGFVARSRRFADKLKDAQTSRHIPGGVLVLFTGRAGNPEKKILGVIKAETHGGFRRTPSMEVQYLKDLFMTPQTKLYKIGVFIYDGTRPAPELPQGWSVVVYDNQMSNANRDGAALYFYEHFLGCSIPVNSAQLTKKFFEGTRDFIKSADISEESKSDLFGGLYTYLKVDRSTTIDLNAFSNQYIGPEYRDDYESFMVRREFPLNAISKDTSEIQSYLRRRKLAFSRNIQLTAPPDAFRDLIQIEAIEGDVNSDGQRPVWTRILVRDRIRDQE